jgi:hypothetical protein
MKDGALMIIHIDVKVSNKTPVLSPKTLKK